MPGASTLRSPVQEHNAVDRGVRKLLSKLAPYVVTLFRSIHDNHTVKEEPVVALHEQLGRLQYWLEPHAMLHIEENRSCEHQPAVDLVLLPLNTTGNAVVMHYNQRAQALIKQGKLELADVNRNHARWTFFWKEGACYCVQPILHLETGGALVKVDA